MHGGLPGRGRAAGGDRRKVHMQEMQACALTTNRGMPGRQDTAVAAQLHAAAACLQDLYVRIQANSLHLRSELADRVLDVPDYQVVPDVARRERRLPAVAQHLADFADDLDAALCAVGVGPQQVDGRGSLGSHDLLGAQRLFLHGAAQVPAPLVALEEEPGLPAGLTFSLII